ncbi:PREDICTED: uncharacterized protein LOC108565569 isoform X2 [Nicrophorus vespilloides]|uniref:Uncharacterized protein LOC108565569 isoform X2 n=1 Tax=Nicrophorus vespilloides TaxID=110193 RepID=A0ABM1N193_NICVS|nr:PREDICTED: uncharacterized protein LOC108565569 isoform X2 [Nicrophorus vespilloides]
MDVKHWGEIVNEEEAKYVPVVVEDVERSMDHYCLSEYEAEYECGVDESDRLTLDTLGPYFGSAIQLHKHAIDITETIRIAELAIESNLIPPDDVVPPIPEGPCIESKPKENCLNFIPVEEPEEYSTDYPELSNEAARLILRKCVAISCAHIGYEKSHESVILLLADALELFLKKFGAQLKIASEEDLGGFPNPVEKVLTELGIGGMKSLEEFFQNRVVNYIGVLQKRCSNLNNHYENLLLQRNLPPVLKTEKIEEDENVVEMHFPTLEGEAGFSSLETGFQLLNSLEAQTNLRSMDDVNVTTTSPGIILESDSLSPYAKKKRTK